MSPFPFLKKIHTSSYDYEEIFTKLMVQLETLDRASENMGEVLRSVLGFIQAEAGSLFLYHAESKKFVLHRWIGSKPLNMSVSAEYEFVTFLKLIQNVLFKDELNENRYVDMRSAGLHYFTQLSCVGLVPLLVKEEWVGLLNVGRRMGGGSYGEEDRSLLRLVGYWLARFISNTLLYDHVRYQNKMLSQVTEVKNQIMANVTHELRTPLSGILGLAEMILEGADGPLTDEQKRHLEMIRNSGQSLLEIVNNILSLVKVEATRNNVEMKRVPFSRLVREVADLFEGIMQAQQVVFISHVVDGFFVYGDEEQIRTVIMNLVGNAVKFTKKGRIEIFATQSGDRAKICVKDTGIGIAEADQTRIFEEFRQADGSITRGYGGTGLGLAIARKIVEIHGGRIWAESRVGKGSEFYFTLPLKPGRMRIQDHHSEVGHGERV